MYRDFLLYYRIDLVDELYGPSPRYTPRILLSLVERLPEGAEYPAEQIGNRELRDWPIQTHLLAAIYNATIGDTAVMAGVPKSKREKLPFIEAPKIPTPKKRKGQSLRFLQSQFGDAPPIPRS